MAIKWWTNEAMKARLNALIKDLNCSYVQKTTVTITKYLFCTLSHVCPLAEV